MALISIYNVVADYYSVDSTLSAGIVEGQVVGLVASTSGKAVVTKANGATVGAIGLAADSFRTTEGATAASSADLVIGANGPVGAPTPNTRWTQNKVTDFFNETVASGKMTVYHSGGKFATDQFVDLGTSASYNVGDLLYAANGLLSKAVAGLPVARVVEEVQSYPSGVPGTDTVDGSMSLGNFLTVILL